MDKRPSPLALAHDAALLDLAALSRAGAVSDPAACRAQRLRAIEDLQLMPSRLPLRAAAIEGVKRSCAACGGCQGV